MNACLGCVIPSVALSAAPAAVDNSGQASLLSQEARASTAPALADPPYGGGCQKLSILVVLAELEALWGLSGIAEHFCKLGAQTAVYDAGGSETRELLAQNAWRELDARIGALDFHGCALVPPSATFAPRGDGGPPVRGDVAPDIYGFRCLPPEVAERVRVETALSLRAAAVARRFLELGLPGWALAGARVPGHPSVLKLPEWQAFADSPGFVASPGVWRAVGAVAERPVEIVHWCADFTGALEAAAGPAAACAPLAGRLVQAAGRNRLSAPEAEAAMVRSGRFRHKLIRCPSRCLFAGACPTPEPPVWRIEAKSVGGMRGPLRSLCKAPGFEKVSAEVRAFLIDVLIKDASVHDKLWAALAGADDNAAPTEAELDVHRPAFAALLGASSWSPARTEAHSSDVRADMLRAWVARAGDPGAGPPCPIGNLAFDALGDASDGESAHLGEEAVEEIKSYASLGWLASAASFEECCERLGGAPVLSKFVLLTKVKEGETKRRLVINLKASSVTAATAKTHRVPLPGVMDAVQDVLELLSRNEGGDQFGVEWLVVDFNDAFWNVPLAVEERRFFVAKVRGVYYWYCRAAQGSRNGPYVWASVAALLARLSQALFADPFAPKSFGELRAALRLQTYVDDPVLTAAGSPVKRRLMLCATVLAWGLLGFGVAFRKARLGTAIVWVGVKLPLDPAGVTVEITSEKVADFTCLLEGFLASNIVSLKRLREFLGKAESVAMVLLVWRPFLRDLWNAMLAASADSSSRAPPGCVWTQQVRAQLEWFLLFLQQERGSIVRRFLVEAYTRRGPAVRMGFDASPWGLGGWLMLDEAFVAYFAAPVSGENVELLGIVVGSAESQQILEDLAILAGMRVWKQHWCQVRSSCAVESDNIAALTMLSKLRAPSPALNHLAKELALDLGDTAFLPEELSHVPG
ncbi:unnamed protein product, partial [Prorocentrum cordatum]